MHVHLATRRHNGHTVTVRTRCDDPAACPFDHPGVPVLECEPLLTSAYCHSPGCRTVVRDDTGRPLPTATTYRRHGGGIVGYCPTHA